MAPLEQLVIVVFLVEILPARSNGCASPTVTSSIAVLCGSLTEAEKESYKAKYSKFFTLSSTANQSPNSAMKASARFFDAFLARVHQLERFGRLVADSHKCGAFDAALLENSIYVIKKNPTWLDMALLLLLSVSRKKSN